MKVRSSTILDSAEKKVGYAKDELLTSEAALRAALRDVRYVEDIAKQRQEKIQELCAQVRYLENEIAQHDEQEVRAQAWAMARFAHAHQLQQQQHQSHTKEDKVGSSVLLDQSFKSRSSRFFSRVAVDEHAPQPVIGKYSDEYLALEAKLFQTEKDSFTQREEIRQLKASIETLNRMMSRMHEETSVIHEPEPSADHHNEDSFTPTTHHIEIVDQTTKSLLNSQRRKSADLELRFAEMFREKEEALERVRHLEVLLEDASRTSAVYKSTNAIATQTDLIQSESSLSSSMMMTGPRPSVVRPNPTADFEVEKNKTAPASYVRPPTPRSSTPIEKFRQSDDVTAFLPATTQQTTTATSEGVETEDTETAECGVLTAPEEIPPLPVASSSTLLVGSFKLIVGLLSHHNGASLTAEESFTTALSNHKGHWIVFDHSASMVVFADPHKGFEFVQFLRINSAKLNIASISVHDSCAHNFWDSSFYSASELLRAAHGRVLFCCRSLPAQFQKFRCGVQCCENVDTYSFPLVDHVAAAIPRAPLWYIPTQDSWFHWWSWKSVVVTGIVCAPGHVFSIPVEDSGTLYIYRDSREVVAIHASQHHAIAHFERLFSEVEYAACAVALESSNDLTWSLHRQDGLQMWNAELCAIEKYLLNSSEFGILFPSTLISLFPRYFPNWKLSMSEFPGVHSLMPRGLVTLPFTPLVPHKFYVPSTNFPFQPETPVLVLLIGFREKLPPYLEGVAKLLIQFLSNTVGGSVLHGGFGMLFQYHEASTALRFALNFFDVFTRIAWDGWDSDDSARLCFPTIIISNLTLHPTSIRYHSSSRRYYVVGKDIEAILSSLLSLPYGAIGLSMGLNECVSHVQKEKFDITVPYPSGIYKGFLPPLGSLGTFVCSYKPKYLLITASKMKTMKLADTDLLATTEYKVAPSTRVVIPPMVNCTLVTLRCPSDNTPYRLLPMISNQEGFTLRVLPNLVYCSFASATNALQFA
eukprot:PhF_6_TR17080/c0_g1_i2/m.26212